MSAATPPPPPNGALPTASNGLPSNGVLSNRSSTGTPVPPDGSRHLDDLVAEATKRAEALLPVPLAHLVNAATDSARHADSLLSFRRRDQAFIEYLTAMTIATDVIQRHRDWPTFRTQRGSSLWNSYWQTLNRLKSLEEQFDKVKQIIKLENQRNGVESRIANGASRSSTPNLPQARPMSVQSLRGVGGTTSKVVAKRDDEMFLEQPAERPANSQDTRPTSAEFDQFTSAMDSNSTTSLARPKPQIRPKPEALHGRTLPASLAAGKTNGVPDLEERFRRLRPMSGPPASSAQNESLPSRMDSTHESFPHKPQQYAGIGSATISSSSSTSMAPPPRPLVPPLPAKLPLDTSIAMNMPKPPESVYSPARNMQTPHNVPLPRTSARSTVRAVSSASVNAPGLYENGSYFPRNNTGSSTTGPGDGRGRRKGSIGLPSEGRSIDAKILLDYMSLYKMLIIDVRDRRAFDEGHIDSVGTICLSPESLRENMTDEDLERATLLSPDNEMALFSRRDQVDLIVYYDQNTQTPAYLSKPSGMRSPQEDSLRYVFDALWELNVAKDLRRPPLMLIGGIDAWSDLLGSASLRTSNTVEMTGLKKQAPSRRPVPAPSPAAMLAMEKRRRREYNPLDAEEERRWQESARKESVYVPSTAEEEAAGLDGEEEQAFYRTQEDFLRRFPVVSPVQESMTEAPMRAEIQYPVQPPPSRPPPMPSGPASSYAANAVQTSDMPSRPAPAAPRVSYSGAHDRHASNGSIVATKNQQLRPYISPQDLPHNIRLPRTGLINFGVTCYMNATLQCLNATIPLSTHFRNDNYISYLQRENWKGARGLFPQHFANLIKHLWVGDVQAVRPTTFRGFCARLDSKYGIDQQQDAKEFLEFALDYLHEDLNIHWRNNPPHVLSKEEEETRERLPKGYAAMIEWTRYSKRSKSLIQDLFAGQHYSKITCLKCGHTSTTYETFFSISVEIPKSGKGTTIEECLRSYCREEILTGAEMPKCEKCNRQREHTKRITLTRAPRFLVVHFKRFTAKLAKIHTPVSFPLRGLSLDEFMLPPLTTADRTTVARETNDPSFLSRPLEESMTGPFRYDAYGVVRHLGGSLGSGHYIAMVRDQGRGCWRQFNDTVVGDFEPGNDCGKVGEREAYVVFFERVGMGGDGGAGGG